MDLPSSYPPRPDTQAPLTTTQPPPCVFQGAMTGLVITTHSSVSIPGLQDVRAFVDAYEARRTC